MQIERPSPVLLYIGTPAVRRPPRATRGAVALPGVVPREPVDERDEPVGRLAGQRLDVTEALRAYTRGGAYAGFDEDRLGTVEAGKHADLVVLERSPWDVDPGDIGDIEVALTLVDGDVVFDGR